MAGYRQFHTQFWKDEWLIELSPLERYLFSYLFTNDLSSISGIFKLPLRVVVNETGLDKDFVTASFAKFQEAKKIFYQDGVMWVVNMRKYHQNASPRTMTKVNADVRDIPDCPVKRAYLYYEKTGEYHIDTISIPRSESAIVSESESAKESASKSVVGGVSYDDVYRTYEKEIGVISAVISDELQDAEKDYPAEWAVEAIGIAATNNARNWKYVQAILKRWKAEGKSPPRSNGKAHEPADPNDIVLPAAYTCGGGQ